MRRVIVIGCPGSGKSTFSRALHARLGLPLVYLDMLYWNADRTTVSREVFRQRLEMAMAGERWIIDGNYSSTMELRLAACDTVFFLDYPPEVCMEGIRSRRGTVRPDMPWVEGQNEVDEEFEEFVRGFARDSRPLVLELLEKYSDREVVVLKSREEAAEYLSNV